MRTLRRLSLLIILLSPLLVLLGVGLMALLGLSRRVPVVAGYVLPMVIVVLVIELIFVARLVFDRKYKQLFSDDHVIELAHGLEKAKAASLTLLQKPYEGEMKFRDDAAWEQGNFFDTSAHLAVYYTIDREDINYRHHLSMSYTRGPLARAGVEHLSGIIGQLMSIDILQAEIFQSERTVGHINFLLNEDEQRLFALRPVFVPNGSEVRALRSKARETVREMREVRRAGSLDEGRPKPA